MITRVGNYCIARAEKTPAIREIILVLEMKLLTFYWLAHIIQRPNFRIHLAELFREGDLI